MWSYFNSQPHEEADVAKALGYSNPRISTHSLTRRLTISEHQKISDIEHFNSQPHEEADPTMDTPPQIERNFNSQPHEEADNFFETGRVVAELFQLTASRGG